MNVSQPIGNSSAADILLPLCEVIIKNTNSTNITQHVYNKTQCKLPEIHHISHTTRVKTYHMQPLIYGELHFYNKYDPFTGVRTASILGSFLFLVVVYALYKAKCKKKQWTSQDRLFVERYKRRFNGRKGRRGTDFAFMHEPFHGSSETSVAMEQTAKWVQSQPLQGNAPKQNFKHTMGNLCLESFKATIYPVCDTNNINHMPNGNLADSRKSEKNSNAEVEIKKLNERNLHYDTYKDIMPMKQNLWKSKSYDDKVNMQTISTMSSLGDLDIPYCDQDINIAGEDDVLYEPPLCPVHDSLTDSGLSASQTDSGSAKPGSPLYQPFPKRPNGQPPPGKPVNLPVLQPITVTPPTNVDRDSPTTPTTMVPAISFPSANDIPMIDMDQCSGPVSFKIGTPSSCSSLDNDECFSLTTSPQSISNLPFPTSIAIPVNKTPIPLSPPSIRESIQNNIPAKPNLDQLSTPLLSIPNDLNTPRNCIVSCSEQHQDSQQHKTKSRSNTPRPSLTSQSDPLKEGNHSPIRNSDRKCVMFSEQDSEAGSESQCHDYNQISQVMHDQKKNNQSGATAAIHDKSKMSVTRI